MRCRCEQTCQLKSLQLLPLLYQFVTDKKPHLGARVLNSSFACMCAVGLVSRAVLMHVFIWGKICTEIWQLYSSVVLCPKMGFYLFVAEVVKVLGK